MFLRNCRLIPELSDGVCFPLADIEIEDDKIRAVRPAAGGPAGEGDVDCGGMTVLPGLFDLHVHLVDADVTNDVYHAMQLYNSTAPLLKNYLDYGITTIRDCGSTMRLACYLRDSVDRGLIEGPHILSSGHIISPEAMRNDGENGIHTFANGTDEALKAARREFACGADFLKIYATQSMTQVRGSDPKCIYSPEEIAVFVQVAKDNNSYVAAHAHSTDAINTCCRYGVRSIEHATYLTDESLKLLTSRDDVWIVPTSAVSEPYDEGDGYNDPRVRAFWNSEHMKASGKRSRGWKNKAYLAGVKFGHGTDLGLENLAKYPYEFRIKRESCKMENVDILRQATMNCAEIAMLGDVTGQIKEGLRADIIAVSGKPDEDIHVMLKKPVIVMKSGVLKRAPGL